MHYQPSRRGNVSNTPTKCQSKHTNTILLLHFSTDAATQGYNHTHQTKEAEEILWKAD
jgi:hypothetical protein